MIDGRRLRGSRASLSAYANSQHVPLRRNGFHRASHRDISPNRHPPIAVESKTVGSRMRHEALGQYARHDCGLIVSLWASCRRRADIVPSSCSFFKPPLLSSESRDDDDRICGSPFPATCPVRQQLPTCQRRLASSKSRGCVGERVASRQRRVPQPLLQSATTAASSEFACRRSAQRSH